MKGLPVIFRKTALAAVAGVMILSPAADIYAQTKAKASKANTAAGTGKATASQTAKPTAGNPAPKTESVKEMKRMQGDVQKEINATRSKLKENELAVKKGLADLTALEGEISVGKKKLDDTSRQVKELSQKIVQVEGNISREEAELKKLREEYLKAVKKIRVKRKSASTLSFIFSSKNFSEAMRRMRYLKEFSGWREHQSEVIGAKVRQLKEQKDLLARTKSEKDAAVREESRLQAKLQTQYKEQDAMVIQLKANGEALRSYLAQKQAEANTLKNRVSALIAEEQRRAAEKRAKEEAARKAEQERKAQLAREEAARKEAARKEAEAKAKREREIAEAKAKSEAEAKAKAKAKADADAKAKAKKEAEAKKQAATPKTTPKTTPKKEEPAKDKDNNNTDYAAARKRRPRSQKDQATDKQSANKPAEKPVPSVSRSENVEKPSAPVSKNVNVAPSGFASMKGSLPRPVSGSFRITSRFGRHALPDLPNVTYDNPGIDAEVSLGASAQAVYEGKVSGVYVVPGYSTVVIVNHGNYYTVYGNIQHASVKVGDSVKQGQNLGKLGPGDDNPSRSSIHFEVWHNRDKMNPSEWIR
ncbi:MAG: peptidoglycan DD-metalloendopeptidase family protein [Muribaculaceae bacterium]|nr:peptidoglycan DD-metalloendopeptidase family protein [Muribaculaceae bacterium]